MALTAARLQKLLAAARQGDQSARGELLEHFRPYLLSIAQREEGAHLRPKEAPSDLVGQTILEAYRDFDQFQGDEEKQFKAWLRVQLVNNLKNVRRAYEKAAKRNVRREQPLQSTAGDKLDLPAPIQTPSETVLAREEENLLLRNLAQLKPRYQQVIHWRLRDKVPFAEIGRRLGVSTEAAAKLFMRAVTNLRELME